MTDEREQLRRYVESQSEDAFAGVVAQCLPFVYATALRRVGGDDHRAKDVTQLVFIALARNAASLAKHPNLTGWLFTTTRFLAAKTLRSEQRRQARETEASMMRSALSEDPAHAAAGALHPLLDDVIAELGEIDRRVILLRFHRGFRLAEIGVQLGVTENAVQKRLTRTIEELKKRLLRRGVTSTAAALTLTLELQSAVNIPAGLAATSAGAATAFATGAFGTFKAPGIVALSKLQFGLLASVLLSGAAVLAWQHHEMGRLGAGFTTQTGAATVRTGERGLAEESGSAPDDGAMTGKLSRTNEAPGGSTRALVSGRQQLLNSAVRRAIHFLHEGKPGEALEVYLAAYAELRSEHPGSVECQVLLDDIFGMRYAYPAALSALAKLRFAGLTDFQAEQNNPGLGMEVALLNKQLGNGARTVAIYDTLPADSPLRQVMGQIAEDEFVQAHRYADALVGKPYNAMVSSLELRMRQASSSGAREKAGLHDLILRSTATNIEVLTGAGHLDEARALTAKLLAFDGSNLAREIINRHVEQAAPSASH